MLKIRYLCGRNDNMFSQANLSILVVICSKFAIFAVEMTTRKNSGLEISGCDLLKIRYLCGRNDNTPRGVASRPTVVICSKFAIFAVEMTTYTVSLQCVKCCDLLKIRYLCGRNDNSRYSNDS